MILYVYQNMIGVTSCSYISSHSYLKTIQTILFFPDNFVINVATQFLENNRNRKHKSTFFSFFCLITFRRKFSGKNLSEKLVTPMDKEQTESQLGVRNPREEIKLGLHVRCTRRAAEQFFMCNW